MEVSLFRNVRNLEQLYYKANLYRGLLVNCRIIDTVELEASDYSIFCQNFMRSYSFLSPYIYTTIIANDVWHGILVKCREKSVVVVMNGYQYARYVGLPEWISR